MKKFALYISIILLLSCQKKEVDLIIHQAHIYTCDSLFSKHEAMAVKQGKIVEIGSSKMILAKYQSKDIRNVNGNFIYPGFHDAHAHFYGLGISRYEVPLYGSKNINEIIQRCKNFKRPLGQNFLCGRGWDQNLFPDKQYPERWQIDSIFPDIPVMLIRIDGHAALLNHKAIVVCGLDTIKQINGGEIIQRAGIANGIVIDRAYEWARLHFPEYSQVQKIDALLYAQQSCFDLGITQVTDAGQSYSIIKLCDSLAKVGQLKITLNEMLEWNSDTIPDFDALPYSEKGPIFIRSIKLYADGALGSRGALLRAPYADREKYNGLLLHSHEFFEKFISAASHSPYQICTHAIGDSAVLLVSQWYAKNLKINNNRRWRIEHVQVLPNEALALMKSYKIIPSVQPTHATSDAPWAGIRLGNRIRSAYAYKQLFNIHQLIALGTDFPVEYPHPMYTFCSAVYRKSANERFAFPFQMSEALSKEETLKGMTIWPAYAVFRENESGSLEKGKEADFQIYTQDFLQMSSDKLGSIKPISLFIRGEQVK